MITYENLLHIACENNANTKIIKMLLGKIDVNSITSENVPF